MRSSSMHSRCLDREPRYSFRFAESGLSSGISEESLTAVWSSERCWGDDGHTPEW